MDQTHQIDDNLESIIAIINQQKDDTNSILRNYYSEKTPNSITETRTKIEINTTVKQTKTLRFKPWSGIGGIRFMDQIKQQSGVEADQQQQQGEKVEKETQETVHQHIENGYYYKFQNGAVKLIKQLLQENGFKNTPQWYQDWTLYWSCGAVKLQIYPFLNPYQKVNHFPNSFQITRKDLMNKNISKMQIKHGYSNFNFLPKTFILPLQLSQFQQQYNKNKKIYIVKPHNRSQGKGIIVTDQLDTIYSRLQKYSSLVVSQYIDNPLLINGYKFDLRIYVGITSVYPLKIYIYQQGLARFATEQYNNSMTEQRKNFRHLTNYSVNKKNQNFVSSSAPNDDYFGSKWALTALKDFIEHNIGKNQANQLFQKIDDLVIKTILSIENLLFTNLSQYVPYVNNCFEILGFDVLIDSTLKPWLVEVNLSPSMNTDSPLDLKIKGNMVSDMFTMLGIFTHPQRYVNNGHLRNLTTKHVNSRGNKNQLEAFQKYVIKSGGWKRVFPSTTCHKFTPFFEVDRYLNMILREAVKPAPIFNQRSQILKYRNSVRIDYNKRRSQSKDIKKQNNSFVLSNKRPSLKFRIR